MPTHTFIAESVLDAVTQIRAKLGPDAVVLHVRPLPAGGLARLWRKPRIEILAQAPARPATARLDCLDEAPAGGEAPSPPPAAAEGATTPTAGAPGWRVGPLLASTGLLPVHVQRVIEELRRRHGELPPESLRKEIGLARSVLADLWPARPAPASGTPSDTHVFVGAPGSGKTTCLCKWLARTVLVEGRTARVWRLDGRTANTAETLSVYAEILGVPVERCAPAEGAQLPGAGAAERIFVDLPGAAAGDATALRELRWRVGKWPGAQVHLVLNSAYELSLLLEQVRAFSVLPVTDLIFTHLDEESRWGKLWNFALGTNFTLGHLSAGQNVPGQFEPATAEAILARQFAP
jgi:flagellar biosynthesis protein FlhF